jgi:4-methyl-5(b-hydroxyethyl)-thiazole monophosphate biosynthesis
MAKKAIVFLADGFEEVEAITPIDYLRRVGVELTTVSIGGSKTVTGSHKIPVIADKTLAEIDGFYDALLVPGGGDGSANLAASAEVGRLLIEQAASGRVVAAICAAPAVVLAPLGLLADKRFTCFPGMEEGLIVGKWSKDRVVVDGNLITSRGAGTAAEWALAIIARLESPEEAEKLAKRVVLR